MTDEGRLELDDSGAVVETLDTAGPRGHASPAPAIDLADPDATDALAHTALDTWVGTTAAPWVGRHRRPVALGMAVAVVTLTAGGWWVSRPDPPPPVAPLALLNAVLPGNDIGGPRVGDDGVLSVAYSATAGVPADRIDVVGIVGPGLTPVGVDAAAVTGTAPVPVTVSARIGCEDRAIASAASSSYGLLVRRTEATGDAVQSLAPFGPATTAIDIAVREHCLMTAVPSAVVVDRIVLTPEPGSSVAGLAVTVRNTSGLPISMSTARSTTSGVEVDLSPTAAVPPGATATLVTRVLVHDCSALPRFDSLNVLPNPVGGLGSSDLVGGPGLTLRLWLGPSSALSSYAIPSTVEALGRQLAGTACAGRPTLTVAPIDAEAAVAADGSWVVTGTYSFRTNGVGITVGREHFSGPAAGQGSVLATTESIVPGVAWAMAPTQLDGGAGRLPVLFSGTSCADVFDAAPSTLAVRVVGADRSVHPFEVPLDTAELTRAVARACGVTTVTIPLPGSHARMPGSR